MPTVTGQPVTDTAAATDNLVVLISGVMYFQFFMRCHVEFDKAVFFRRICLQYI